MLYRRSKNRNFLIHVLWWTYLTVSGTFWFNANSRLWRLYPVYSRLRWLCHIFLRSARKHMISWTCIHVLVIFTISDRCTVYWFGRGILTSSRWCGMNTIWAEPYCHGRDNHYIIAVDWPMSQGQDSRSNTRLGNSSLSGASPPRCLMFQIRSWPCRIEVCFS